MGSAALDMAYVAAGRCDGFWQRDLNYWDIAAGIIIVKEAGGFITDFQGNNKYIKDKNINIIHGDSKKVLQILLCIIDEPVYMFLDASTETTSMLIDELEIIMQTRTEYSDIVTFNNSHIDKIGKNGTIITLNLINKIIHPTHFLVKNGDYWIIQNSGSDTSEHTSSSSDSF